MSDERSIEKRLEQLSAEAAQRSRLRSAADIRKRAGRRRASHVLATGLVTAAVVLVTWTVAAPGTEDRSVEPTQSPTPTATTTKASTDPTASQTTTGSTAELPPLPADPPPGGWVTTLPVPASLVLPHDGQKSAHPGEFSDWGVVKGSDGWLMVPCDAMEDAGYPSDAARTDHRAIIQTGPELAFAEQIAIYPSDVDAIQAMQELRQALVDCAQERTLHDDSDGYTDSSWDFMDAVDVTRADGLTPDEAFQAWNMNSSYASASDEAPYPFGGGFFTVTRVGNAIMSTMRDGETQWGAPGAPQAVAVTEAKATQRVLGNLCKRYSGADGC